MGKPTVWLPSLAAALLATVVLILGEPILGPLVSIARAYADPLTSGILCQITCDRSPLGTDVQLSRDDLFGPRNAYVIAIGQTIGLRVHDGIAGPFPTNPAILRRISEQQVGSVQLTARYRAVGIGFTQVGFQPRCFWGACAMGAPPLVSVVVATTRAVIHLTDADNGRTVNAKVGQAIDVPLDKPFSDVFISTTSGQQDHILVDGPTPKAMFLASRSSAMHVVTRTATHTRSVTIETTP